MDINGRVLLLSDEWVWADERMNVLQSFFQLNVLVKYGSQCNLLDVEEQMRNKPRLWITKWFSSLIIHSYMIETLLWKFLEESIIVFLFLIYSISLFFFESITQSPENMTN